MLGWWDRLLGRKGLEYHGTSEVESVVLGYPGYPFLDAYGSLYRKQPAVRTVVDFQSRNLAQLNPKIYARLDDSDRREWSDHPLAEILRKPNPATTRFAFMRDTVADLKVYDIAYWRKVIERGLVRALVRLPPSRIQIEFDQTRLRTTFRFDGRALSREELVIFHGYHPDGGEQGVSPLETLRQTLAEEWAARIHREFYWRNAARAPGVLLRPKDAGVWSEPSRERFRKHWEETTAGARNAGRWPVLEEGMTAQKLDAFSPKDSEYIEGRKLTYVEVARVYAPSLVGLLGDDTKANVESFHRQLYQDVLAVDARMIQDEVDSQLLSLPEFDFGISAYCEFNLAEKLRGSFEEENRALTTAVGVPYLTINEARAMQNKTRITEEWADIPVQPLNVLYGGQPAPTIPTEVPEPGAASAELQAKLLAFFDRQEQRLLSTIGALKNQGEITVTALWDDERWNRELAAVYSLRYDGTDSFRAAADANALLKTSIVNRYPEEGREAIREVFRWARANVAEFSRPRPQQPALTA